MSLFLYPVWAQEGKAGFEYLLLPQSVHSSALGGANISLIENDVSLIFDNPSLLGPEMDLTFQASYLDYVSDIRMGNVVFTKASGERSAWGIGALYSHYGAMQETTEENLVLGSLTANDICGSIFFSHDLNDKIRGGISGKFFYSNYYHNTAIGLGVDLGLSYYDSDRGFSIGLVGKNIGRQIKAYEEEIAGLPWDIQLGITKTLNHAPVRFSITGVYLKQWKLNSVRGGNDSFFKTLGKHLILGVDLIPSDNFWIGVGYNVKRGSDMYMEEGNKLGGFSAGAGLRLKAFSFGCAVGKYNTAATSFMFSVATSFAEMKL
ncbi:MAG: type IX secretion system protein PorQ [Candidatus Azobacteroides sp.]|nr:type IX secretion system protein PorQ [Candidatus Azobacteroides sp.]